MPKSRILTRPSLRQEQVLGLEIAVDDALLVCGRQTARDLDAVLDGLARAERARRHPVAQRLALQQLRDDVGRAVVLAGVVDGDDVGVVEGAGGFGLVLEAAQALGVLGEVGVDDLERYVAGKPLVTRAIDLAHPALAEQGQHLVRPDASARREVRRRGSRCRSRLGRAVAGRSSKHEHGGPDADLVAVSELRGRASRGWPRRKVPFLLPRSSRTALPSSTTIRAWCRDTRARSMTTRASEAAAEQVLALERAGCAARPRRGGTGPARRLALASAITSPEKA